MGRWTPLILMAGGLAILLGTLLGINFPMDGRNAQAPTGGRKESQVLPANINVNSTATNGSAAENENQESAAQNNNVAQNNDNNGQIIRSAPTTTAQRDTPPATSSPESSSTSQSSQSENNAPIRALW